MIKLTNIFKDKTQKELENIVNSFYQKNIQGSCVVNKETNYTICFNAIGRKKTAFGGNRINTIMTPIKATAIHNLKELIINAIYLNTAPPKQKHIIKYGAIGFINFKTQCEIDNKYYSFKISAMIKKNDYKVHYSINEDYNI